MNPNPLPPWVHTPFLSPSFPLFSFLHTFFSPHYFPRSPSLWFFRLIPLFLCLSLPTSFSTIFLFILYHFPLSRFIILLPCVYLPLLEIFRQSDSQRSKRLLPKKASRKNSFIFWQKVENSCHITWLTRMYRFRTKKRENRSTLF